MPFDASFDDVYDLGIKPAANSAGAYCERVDEQIFEGSILARVYNQIAKADLIVADMSGRNPNVFYEVVGLMMLHYVYNGYSLRALLVFLPSKCHKFTGKETRCRERPRQLWCLLRLIV